MLAPLLRLVDSKLKLGASPKYLPLCLSCRHVVSDPHRPHSSFLPSELVVARRLVWESRHLARSGQAHSPGQAHSGQRTVPGTGTFPRLSTEDPASSIGETEAALSHSNYAPPGSASTLPLIPVPPGPLDPRSGARTLLARWRRQGAEPQPGPRAWAGEGGAGGRPPGRPAPRTPRPPRPPSPAAPAATSDSPEPRSAAERPAGGPWLRPLPARRAGSRLLPSPPAPASLLFRCRGGGSRAGAHRAAAAAAGGGAGRGRAGGQEAAAAMRRPC